jgi:hypothetical protein
MVRDGRAARERRREDLERAVCVDGEVQRELVRAYLAGYWQAVEDFRGHAARGAARSPTRFRQLREWWRRAVSTSGTTPPKDR